MKNNAVFLDRDGTINKDIGYLSNPDDFHLLACVPIALRLLQEHSFLLFIVSNQSGIERGYFTKDALEAVNSRMEELLAREGISLTAIYCCPHHPNSNCDCRKPATKMFYEAAKCFDVELNQSYMVGDKVSDVVAGLKAGCKAIWLSKGNSEEQLMQSSEFSPHFITRDLYEAAQWIIGDSSVDSEGTKGNRDYRP